jgi:hypothetical protein
VIVFVFLFWLGVGFLWMVAVGWTGQRVSDGIDLVADTVKMVREPEYEGPSEAERAASEARFQEKKAAVALRDAEQHEAQKQWALIAEAQRVRLAEAIEASPVSYVVRVDLGGSGLVEHYAGKDRYEAMEMAMAYLSQFRARTVIVESHHESDGLRWVKTYRGVLEGHGSHCFTYQRDAGEANLRCSC